MSPTSPASPDSPNSQSCPVFTRTLPTEADTINLAQQLAQVLTPGMVVTFSGDLGAGKTTLVRALLRALGITGTIKSPTYTLVESYRIPVETAPHTTPVKVLSGIYFYHFDFYRFVDPDEWLEAGFEEYFDGATVVLIEWPERADDLLPTPDLHITLTLPTPPASGRIVTMQANTPKGYTAHQCLTQRLANL